MLNIVYAKKRVANSMVEYSAFNRFVPGSIPGQPINGVCYEQEDMEQKGDQPTLVRVADGKRFFPKKI